jgi:hypothetical protein
MSQFGRNGSVVTRSNAACDGVGAGVLVVCSRAVTFRERFRIGTWSILAERRGILGLLEECGG